MGFGGCLELSVIKCLPRIVLIIFIGETNSWCGQQDWTHRGAHQGCRRLLRWWWLLRWWIHYKDNNNIILSLALLTLKTYKSTSLSETEMQVARLCPFITELRPIQAVTADSPAQVASRNWWGHHQSAHKMADSTLVEVVGEGEEKFA